MAEVRPLVFDVYRDGEILRTERLAQDVVKIGSHAKSHIFLDDPNVSRVHAVVEVSGDDVFVIDLGSGRGTFVNGERVNKQKLEHGDRIRLGSMELVVRLREDSAATGLDVAAGLAELVPARTDEDIYAERFLALPSNPDGSVEIAMLFQDFVLADELFKPPATVKVGSNPGCHFEIETDLIEGGEFTLIDVDGGEPQVQFTDRMSGEVYIDEQRFTLDELRASGRARRSGNHSRLPLTNATRARLVLGDLVFFVHRSSKPTLYLPIKRDWKASTAALMVSALIQLGFIGLALLMPPEVEDLKMGGFNPNDRFVQLLVKEMEKPPEELPDFLKPKEPEEKPAGEEGKAGEETAKPEEDKKMAIEGDREKPEDVELARAQAREEVQNRGALEVLNNLGPSSMFGGDSAEGLDDLQAIGSTQGEGVGAAYGQSGLGRYGGGFGAGGTLRQSGVSGGPIGLGGRSSGGNLGGNLRQNVERAARPPTVVPGTGGVTGGLDMAIIRRVITEHRREIVACYESALQRNPELEGRVVIEWVIAPDGAVAAAKVANTTLNNADVEACMQRRVRQWRFPEPKGGVTARVNFPWVFTPGD